MKTEIKERPMLFSSPMVRAILDGSKTQTRRVVKVQPPADGYELLRIMETTGPKKQEGKLQWAKLSENRLSVLDSDPNYFDCPYGQPGDRLYVRETWRASSAHDDLAPRDIPVGDGIEYLVDGERILTGKTRTSIHMPRWASRIQLEIVSVRVERLNDISEKDAIAEGVDVYPEPWDQTIEYRDYSTEDAWIPAWGDTFDTAATLSFKSLWESINGAGSWSANPWVWVIEFKRA